MKAVKIFLSVELVGIGSKCEVYEDHKKYEDNQEDLIELKDWKLQGRVKKKMGRLSWKISQVNFNLVRQLFRGW